MFNNFNNMKKFNLTITKILKYNNNSNYFEIETKENYLIKGKIKNFQGGDTNKLIGNTISISGEEKMENNKKVIIFFNSKVIEKIDTSATELIVVTQRMIWESVEDSYYIIDTDKGVIKGHMVHPYNDIKDLKWKIIGEWKKNSQGYAFEFKTIQLLNKTIYIFLTKFVKGIGPKLAEKLLEQFGEKGLKDILNNNPETLLTVKGLKEKKLRKIEHNWELYNHLEELTILLGDNYGEKTITKIFNFFGKQSIEIIKTNPYRLADIKSIGFKIADKIKYELEIEVDSLFRIIAGINYTIDKDMNDNGNTYIDKSDLFKVASEELNLEEEIDKEGKLIHPEFILNEELFEEALTELEHKNNKQKICYLDKEKTLISNVEYFNMETYIYEFCNTHNQQKNIKIIDNIEEYIEEIQIEMGMTFSDEQKEEIEIANEGYKFISLSGYAGSGKSTISKAIINLLVKKYGDSGIICTAISGMAANRIKETSGFDSSTMHSLLKFKQGEFEYNENNKLPFDIILLDESSMVNTFLFYSFLKAIDKDTVLLIVGDPAQLPPIGPGNIYSDIIEKKLVPGTTLTKIYRQSEDAVITHFASYIRKGEIPPNLNGKFDDFKIKFINNSWGLKNLTDKEQKEAKDKNQFMIANDIKTEIVKIKKNILSKYKPGNVKSYVNYFQIITAMKGGILGTINLNKVVQKILNEKKSEDYPHLKIYNNTELRIKDKILHKRNANMKVQSPIDYKKDPFIKNVLDQRIYNGQLGVIIAIDNDMEEIHVFFPNEEIIVNYTFHEAKDYLDLSYALTIHKTQGSEFNKVIIPVVNAHFIMLNNQLMYTALTRAKEDVFIIGHNFAFEKSVTTKSNELRKTILKYIS